MPGYRRDDVRGLINEYDARRYRRASRAQKPNNINASWINLFIASILLLIAGIIVAIVAAERTYSWLVLKSTDIPIEFLLTSGWLIAILTIWASIHRIIGTLQNRNL